GKKPHSKYIKSAQNATIAVFMLIAAASVTLFISLFRRDFKIEYVAQYSNRSLSWFYPFAALWEGQASSLLFWCLLLSLFAVIVLRQNRHRQSDLLPYALGVMQTTIFFFLYLLVFKSNPFTKLPFTPTDGQGLNPLLQNPEMVFHPPSLYIGFVGYTVPFAFALAALITGRLDEHWLKSIRRWTLFSWLFLTLGNVLGMQWAYVELGWGGYWAWDPVENSSLMPWLTGTAFLHSMIVQERRHVLKRWTLSLIILTFTLTIFGTFVTRSGLISSVHAFGVSNLGPLFLGFLALIIIVSISLMIKRMPELSSKNDIGTWSSKESGFLINNLLFVSLTIGIFIGILMPTISELVQGEQLTVGEDFFNRWAIPIGLSIFLLIGVCTVLSWMRTTIGKVWQTLRLPLAFSFIIALLLVLFGIGQTAAVIAIAIAVFSLSVIVQDLIQSVRIYKNQQDATFLSSILVLIQSHKRRYGGSIVHSGILLFFLGLIGSSSFITEKTATLKKGENLQIGGYQLLFSGIERSNAKDRIIDAAVINISKNGRPLGIIKSEKHLFDNFQPATEVGIRSTLKEDVYVILGDYEQSTQMATLVVLINPLVMWLCLGATIMVIVSIICMLPDRRKK
ncbi:MAG: heme lyase CcmF/NrfE family subunit, partial [Calditrichaeota bacterium]